VDAELAVEVSAQQVGGGQETMEAGEDRRVGVAEAARLTHRDDHPAWPSGAQEGGGGGCTAAVVAELEDVAGERLGGGGDEGGFSRVFHVTGEKESTSRDGHTQDLTGSIGVADRSGRDKGVHAADGGVTEMGDKTSRRVAQAHPAAGSEAPQGCLATVRRPPPRIPQLADREGGEDGVEAAHVVRLRVGEGDYIEVVDAEVGERRYDHLVAEVESAPGGAAAIHQEGVTVSAYHQDGVALAHVEGDQLGARGCGPEGEGGSDHRYRCDQGGAPAPGGNDGDDSQS